MSGDGKPISQMFSEDLNELIKKYHDSGLENSQAVGVIEMTSFNLKYELRDDAAKSVRPF